jgi:hypothetical protein
LPSIEEAVESKIEWEEHPVAKIQFPAYMREAGAAKPAGKPEKPILFSFTLRLMINVAVLPHDFKKTY